MSKPLKIILFAVGGLVVFLVLVAVALHLFVDANAYKPRLEAAASGVLGMEVRVGGRVGIGFFPGLHVTLQDVNIRNRGADLASAKQASVGIDLLPLLYQEVQIGKIALKQPRISIERDHDGKYNFEKPEAAGGMLPALNLASVSFSDATLLYLDKPSGEGFEAVNCNLSTRRLRLAEGKSSDLLKHLSFTAELACGEIRKNDFMVSDLKLSADGKNGVFDLKPITMHLFGAQGSGSIQADFSGAVPIYHVRYSLPQFPIEELFKALSPNKVAEGPMDFSVNLSLQGKTVNEMLQTAEGEISLRGENLTLKGADLDLEFARYETSQNFNLVDVGAFFFAGPFGMVVTKGYNFASIFQGSEGSSEIRILVSDWKIERGVAHSQDVAMATKQNRVALTGRLDLLNQRFDDVTMALIDAQGCAMVRQKIHGPFQKPVVEKPNILMSLAGPAVRLLKKGRDLFPGGECEVFYAGSVTPPK
ncbi:MAG: AsmA family protein [Sulfuricaulis sp.]|uniref:AsmA family protein n=1 Tax=Sulfuricaulis sp. TaxID=2003553 RepID=UPI003C698119